MTGPIRSTYQEFPPGPAIRKAVTDRLSAFHPITADEVARRMGRTTPRQIREVENVLRYLKGRCEVKQDEDGGWRSC